MSSAKTEAEMMFWGLPEMAKRLVWYLDAESILALAQVHNLTRALLQSESDWKKIITRVLPGSVKISRFLGLPIPDHSILSQDSSLGLRARLASERQKMVHLVHLLKMVEDRGAHLHALLDLVCERFPPTEQGPKLIQNTRDEDGDRVTGEGYLYIDLNYPPVHGNCSRQHTVSPLGYMLLEKVEEAFRHNTGGTLINLFDKNVLFKGILKVGRNKTLRQIWAGLEAGPGDFLDVQSTCGGCFHSFWGGNVGEEDWRKSWGWMVDLLVDFQDRECPCGGVLPILERKKK